MQRKTSAHYLVKSKETVEITVTPVKVAPLIGAARSDGDPLIDQTPEDKDFTFEFVARKPVGTVVFVKIAGQFTGKEATTARYEIALSGQDEGDGVALSPILRPTNDVFAERSRVVRFEVVS